MPQGPWGGWGAPVVPAAPVQTTPGTVSAPTTSKNYGVPIGVYIGGALVVVALADTKAAPVVVAALAAVAIYNANYIINRRQRAAATPSSQGQSGFAPGTGYAGGGGGSSSGPGGGGGGSW